VVDGLTVVLFDGGEVGRRAFYFAVFAQGINSFFRFISGLAIRRCGLKNQP
jgi:hypothetical protein